MADSAVGDTVLDLGCVGAPNPYLRGKRVVGYDRQDMGVRPPYTEHIVGDVFEIDDRLANQRFDTVIGGEVIEHVERPFELLQMLRRHIVPCGRLVLSTPNVLSFPMVLTEYALLNRFYYTDEHVFAYSPRWVWRLLERSGFAAVKMLGCGICGPFALWIPAPACLSFQVIYVATPPLRRSSSAATRPGGCSRRAARRTS